MSAPQTASQVLERTFLDIRCKILEIAAALDRIERADNAEETDRDPRIEQIRASLALLGDKGFDRAERVQILFSDPYDADWNK